MNPDQHRWLTGLINSAVHSAVWVFVSRSSNKVLVAILLVGGAFMMWTLG